MTSPKRYSLADVRRSYASDRARAELSYDLPVYFGYRPLSFPVAYLALLAGVPALAVTIIGLVLTLGLVLAAVRGGPHAYLWVAAFAMLCEVLDCVDGNMARTSGQASRFGALLDGFADSVFWCALLGALGVLVQREHGAWFSPHGLELGMASALFVLLHRKLRDHYQLLFGAPAVLGELGLARPTPQQWLLYGVLGLEHLYGPAIALLGGAGSLHWLLAAAASYSCLLSIVAVALTLRDAWQHERGAARTAADGGASIESTEHEAGVLPAERE